MLRILKLQRPTGLLASLAKKSEPGIFISLWQVVAAAYNGDVAYIEKPGIGRQLYRYVLRRAQLRGDDFFTVSMDHYAMLAISAGLPVCYLCWSTPVAPVKKALFTFFVRRCRRIIVNDTITRQVLVEDYGVKPDKVCFIRLGVDTEFFRPLPGFSTRKVIIPGSAFRDESIAETILRNTDYSIVRLANMEHIARHYEGLQSRYGNRVALYANVRHGELPRIYSGAVACVLHTCKASEPAGLTCVVESMACGLPVLTNNAKSGLDYIEAGKTGWVYGSSSDLVSILKESSLDELVGMRAKAREWAEKNISWDQLQTQYARALKS
ncbi:MAG: glycosyltransferase family 4 protein [Alphaproteobacteria bacterium]|nr:glycosyltransferase family 4 protein [Alphaproteobacteria bacterium]